MPFSIFGRLLGENSSSGEVRTVSFYTERCGIVRKGKDRRGSDFSL
jgi:hypothetical protein